MSEALQASFEAGSGLSITAVALFINITLGAVATAWAAWTAIGSFQLWRLGEANFMQFALTLVRALIVVQVLFWIFGS